MKSIRNKITEQLDSFCHDKQNAFMLFQLFC